MSRGIGAGIPKSSVVFGLDRRIPERQPRYHEGHEVGRRAMKGHCNNFDWHLGARIAVPWLASPTKFQADAADGTDERATALIGISADGSARLTSIGDEG